MWHFRLNWMFLSQVILYLPKIKSHACFEARNNKLLPGKNIQNVLTNIKLFIYIYIFIYYMVHCKRMRRSLCTNKALLVNERRPESVEPSGEMRVSKELDQMKSTVNSAAVRQQLAAAPPSWTKSKWEWHDLTSSFKTCMWWRRHTEVSRLPFFTFLYSFVLSLLPHWIHRTHTCCLKKKRRYFLQIELSYFWNVFFFFFLRKQICFFLHSLSKQS